MFKGFFIGLAATILFIVGIALLPWKDPYHAGARLLPIALLFGFLVFLYAWKLDAQKKKRADEAELAAFHAKTPHLNEKNG